MESQPQNPEFMNNPENFHPCCSSHLQNRIILPFLYFHVAPMPPRSQFSSILLTFPEELFKEHQNGHNGFRGEDIFALPR